MVSCKSVSPWRLTCTTIEVQIFGLPRGYTSGNQWMHVHNVKDGHYIDLGNHRNRLHTILYA